MSRSVVQIGYEAFFCSGSCCTTHRIHCGVTTMLGVAIRLSLWRLFAACLRMKRPVCEGKVGHSHWSIFHSRVKLHPVLFFRREVIDSGWLPSKTGLVVNRRYRQQSRYKRSQLQRSAHTPCLVSPPYHMLAHRLLMNETSVSFIYPFFMGRD